VIAAQIVVLAKEPLPGKVKTRLAPVYGPHAAAALALAALQDTLDAAQASRAARVLLALDGRPGAWLPDGVVVVPQRDGPLGDRLAGAIADSYRTLPLPVLLIGMDTPQVTAELLDTALQRLTDSAAVLGPANDGGYWCIGLQHPDSHAFDNVPMSQPHTGSAQLDQLAARGLHTTLLPPLRDVDLPSDVPIVAALAPGTRFALVAGLADSNVA
jgi:rSAM/selenodomain-associated transferase 1